jgi:recombination protein RecA
MTPSDDVSRTLAAMQARWGSAAPRRWGATGLETEGALARAPMPMPAELPTPTPAPAPDTDGRVVSTGFAALDAILSTGGLPRSATVALRGDASSGKTTLALRTAAAAQAGGAIVAWLDLARAFDPVEAVARGIVPEWLVVLTPPTLEDALAMAGSLLAARTVDVLVLDLPEGRDPATERAQVGDRLGRLAALARRAGTLLVVLEPAALGKGLAAAVEQASGLRLELRRSGWIRLGRDIVGQRSTADIGRNRYGTPGRSAELEILYAEGGPRDACLAKPALLHGLAGPVAPPGLRLAAAAPPGLPAPPGPRLLADPKGPHLSIDPHASLAPSLATSAPAPGEGAPRPLRVVAVGSGRPRRPALDGRDGGGRGPARPGDGRSAGDPARRGAPAGAGGRVPQSGS